MSSIYLSKEKAIFNGFSKRYRFNKSILKPEYASYLFRGKIFREKVKKYATGYTRYNVSQKNLEKIKINIPTLKIQKQIIDIIEPHENLFLKYYKCVRINKIQNTKNDIKNLIDIIEPLEKILFNIKQQINLFEKFINKIRIEKTNKTNIFSKIQTGKLNVSASLKNGKYPFFTCGKKVMRTNSNSFNGRYILLSGNGEIYN
jgi:type I restriction enzyme S subunit